MLTMHTAFTREIDDPAIAAAEITEQLKDKKLLKNTVGIIACYSECFETGVVKAIYEALSYDVIGCAVMGSAINGNGNMMQLSLTVLTSDELTFSTGFSDIISAESIKEPLEKAWSEAQKQISEKPSLVFALCPIIKDVCGDQMLQALNSFGGGTPIFGTLSHDTSLTYKASVVFHNGEYHLHKAAILMIHGNIKPRFHTVGISQANIQRQYGTITDSEGYTLKSINNLSLHDYFSSLGITIERLKAITMLPFLVDFADGTEPAAYSMYSISEQGALCGCEIPVGAKITFANIDRDGVMETSKTAVEKALADAEQNGANGIIAIPCFSRSLVLSPGTEDEINQSVALVGNRFPFSLIYSGGEICPVYKAGREEFVNRFHNLTYTLMVF